MVDENLVVNSTGRRGDSLGILRTDDHDPKNIEKLAQIMMFGLDNNNSGISFETLVSGVLDERMKIDGKGNVGIGNVGIIQGEGKLVVKGDTYIGNGKLKVDQDSYLAVSSGSVGIGTVDISEGIKLEVNGIIKSNGIKLRDDIVSGFSKDLTPDLTVVNGDSMLPTHNAVKTYVDSKITKISGIIWTEGITTYISSPYNRGSINFESNCRNTAMVIDTENGRVDVKGSLNVNGSFSLNNGNIYGQLAKLDVADEFTATIRAADFCLGHSTRRGSPGRALVDYGKILILNNGNDWIDGVQHYGKLKEISSRKSKENIKNLSSHEAFEALEKLNPVKFNLKADDGKTLYLGFIAEDVPDLVSTSDREAIINSHIVAILTRIIKDQQKTITALADDIRILKNNENGVSL